MNRRILSHSLGFVALLLFVPEVFAQDSALAPIPVRTAAPTSFLAGKRVLWLGDSITQDGSYVTHVEYFLDRAYPKENFDIICIGLASETVSGLSEKGHPFPRPCVLERLGRALEKTRPDYIFASYGMNDGIYHPPSAERLKVFQKGISTLLASTRAIHAKVILLTPTPFDPLPVRDKVRPAGASDYAYFAPYENYDDDLVEHGKWEMTLRSPEVFSIDLHPRLADYLKTRRATSPAFHFSGDGIHPSAAGHLLMAQTILSKLGVAIEVPDLDNAVAELTRAPLYALVKQHRETRSDGWLPYVGYTRGQKVSAPSIAATEKRATALQGEIDSLRSK